MDNYLSFSLTVFAGFFAIMNPVGGVTVFLSLTQGADKNKKKRISRKATTVAFMIGLAFIVFGTYLFKFFGITIRPLKLQEA